MTTYTTAAQLLKKFTSISLSFFFFTKIELRVKCIYLIVSLKHPFSLKKNNPDFQLMGISHVAWQQSFFVGLPSLAFGWLRDAPEYRSVQLQYVNKAGIFQFLLDTSILFALIKVPILLVPPHNSCLYLCCPDHIPV